MAIKNNFTTEENKVARKVKKISIELWEYLRDHPEIKHKSDVPDELYNKIKESSCDCLLCEFFIYKLRESCFRCPLFINGRSCFDEGKVFRKWTQANNEKEREKYAAEIVEKIKAWRI